MNALVQALAQIRLRALHSARALLAVPSTLALIREELRRASDLLRDARARREVTKDGGVVGGQMGADEWASVLEEGDGEAGVRAP